MLRRLRELVAAGATVIGPEPKEASGLHDFAVTGERRFAAAYTAQDGSTTVPLAFEPCGSWFVVFRATTAARPATAQSNTATFSPLAELTGTWSVSFDPRWGGPGAVEFPALASWPRSNSTAARSASSGRRPSASISRMP